MSGIDPRNGTALFLIMMRIHAGWSDPMVGIIFDHPWPLEVAAALCGKGASPEAYEQADYLWNWYRWRPSR